MAIGIFGLGALGRLEGGKAVERPLALILLALWMLIAASYLSYRMEEHVRDAVGSFQVGTWVAGTAVLDEMLVLAFPAWRSLQLALGLVALGLWVWFIILILRGFARISAEGTGRVTGRVLLSTVATQSIVILIYKFFSENAPQLPLATLIWVGYLFYVIGSVMVAHRYLRSGWNLVEDWNATNCILHGAMSITGLAAVLTGAVPAAFAVAVWIWVISMFVLVEGIEVLWAVKRIRRYGWRRGVFAYHVSQWSRNFTFGMLYAFTWQLSAQLLPTSWMRDVHSSILSFGGYVVLLALVAEIAVFLACQLTPREITRRLAPTSEMRDHSEL